MNFIITSNGRLALKTTKICVSSARSIYQQTVVSLGRLKALLEKVVPQKSGSIWDNCIWLVGDMDIKNQLLDENPDTFTKKDWNKLVSEQLESFPGHADLVAAILLNCKSNAQYSRQQYSKLKKSLLRAISNYDELRSSVKLILRVIRRAHLVVKKSLPVVIINTILNPKLFYIYPLSDEEANAFSKAGCFS